MRNEELLDNLAMLYHYKSIEEMLKDQEEKRFVIGACTLCHDNFENLDRDEQTHYCYHCHAPTVETCLEMAED